MRKETDEPLCQIHHLQLLVSGRFAVQLEDGEYAEIEPNDIFDVPPGHDAWVLGDEPAVIVDFLGNIEQLGLPASKDRIVTTLLMTDIVDSTAIASRLGDGTWKQKLGEHNRLVRARTRALPRHGGEHDGRRLPGDVRQRTWCDRVRGIDPRRDRRHRTARPDRRPHRRGRAAAGDIGGVAVHAAARVMALGGASEIMVSSSTRGLIEDGGLRFESRGVQRLKGLPTPLEVFALVD